MPLLYETEITSPQNSSAFKLYLCSVQKGHLCSECMYLSHASTLIKLSYSVLFFASTLIKLSYYVPFFASTLVKLSSSTARQFPDLANGLECIAQCNRQECVNILKAHNYCPIALGFENSRLSVCQKKYQKNQKQ